MGKTNVIVGTVYRPPNQNLDSFLNEFKKILSIITKHSKQCHIMGDFNLDLLHYDQHGFTQEFIDSLFSHMFIPLINRPTRLTSHSATLIDNIFTNCFSQNGVNGIVLNDISDHLPVFAISSAKTLACEKGIKSYKRDYSEINITKFQSYHTLTGVLSWWDRTPINYMILLLQNIIDILKTASLLNTPWITKGLLTSVRTKHKLYKKYLANPIPYRDSHYKNYKNKLNHLIRIAKKHYYDKSFKLAESDIKKNMAIN